MEDISLKFVMAKEDYGQYAELLQKGDLEVTQPKSLKTPEDETLVDAKFVELIAVIAAGTVAAMAIRLFDLLVQKRENGTVIDFRKEPPEVSLVSNVPYGTLVVVDQQGKSSVEKIDPNKTTDNQALITGIIEKYAKS